MNLPAKYFAAQAEIFGRAIFERKAKDNIQREYGLGFSFEKRRPEFGVSQKSLRIGS